METLIEELSMTIDSVFMIFGGVGFFVCTAEVLVVKSLEKGVKTKSITRETHHITTKNTIVY